MPRFYLSEENLGEYPVWALTDKVNGTKARIAHLGATLLSLEIPYKNSMFNIVDGFATAEEFSNPAGARSYILAPFSNRIQDGKYSIGNNNYTLEINDLKCNNAIHGLVFRQMFNLLEKEETETFVRIKLGCDYLNNKNTPGYPFNVYTCVEFTLCETTLFVTVSGENRDVLPVYFGSGWHPYFTTPSKSADALFLTIPANGIVATDNRLIPLEGKHALKETFECHDLDFYNGKLINNRIIDACFWGMIRDLSGYAHTVINDKSAGICIDVFQSRGLMHVYTGDKLTIRPRESIALEPVEFMTNVFNRPEYHECLFLSQGKTRSFPFGVSWKTGNTEAS